MMEWEKQGGGDFIKWADGGVYEGQYLGSKPTGKFGPVGELKTATGVKAFGMNTQLLGDFKLIEPGDFVRIVYKGKKPTKSGTSAHSFEVFKGVETPF